MLYHTFSPELSVDRSQYAKSFAARDDRQSDIPEVVVKKLSGSAVKVEAGSVELRKGEEVNFSAWQDLVDVVGYAIQHPGITIDPARKGLELLKPDVRLRRLELLRNLYCWWQAQGNSLPSFESMYTLVVPVKYDTLSKYTEFVGDRLNDIIVSMLRAAQQSFPQEFQLLLGTARVDFGRLANALEQLWKSPLAVEQKEQRVMSILKKNGFTVTSLDWQVDWGVQEIARWLVQFTVIEKDVVAKIKEQLIVEQS
ncbi:hypothetical protein HY490_05090 [Candidatus Woesearchaeota archaeon]|nr:hypothetical protein [Candidatus Woesearchaeota archaeon]